MAETFLAHPSMNDEQLIQGISSETKFFILLDHYNLPPIGGENVNDFLNGKIALIDELINQHPDCLFILESISKIARTAPNVLYLPHTVIDSSMFSHTKQFDIDWKPRPKTCNHRGGQPRTSRILTDYWLAKNYPMDQLLYTKQEETNLDWVIDIISHSPYTDKKHLQYKKFLPPQWISMPGGADYRNKDQWKFYFDQLLPQIILPSYITLQTESNDHYPSFHITEKTFLSMLGGTMQLHLGNWQVNQTIDDLGLENFDNVFDHEHLLHEDPYFRTIGGLEKNKDFIRDHQLVEQLWHENIKRIQHNHRTIKDFDHWRQKFKKELNYVKDSLNLTIEIGREYDYSALKRVSDSI